MMYLLFGSARGGETPTLSFCTCMVGPTKREPETILTITGGGYTQPCQYGYFHYLNRLVKDMNADKNTTKSISVLLPAYTLVPEAHYPMQLNEAATVLSYLISGKKRSPANIVIGGDSAGGNLALSLLSHILHPRPDTPRVELTTPLRGALLYSPWVCFSTEHDSYVRNGGKDTLIDSMLRSWGSMYLGLSKDGEVPRKDVETDNYNEPLRNDSAWWQNIHRVVGKSFIWMGKDEVFVDGLREFAGIFEQGWNAGGGNPAAFDVYEAADQPHIGPIMDVLMENPKKYQSQLAIEDWLRKLVGERQAHNSSFQ